MRLCHTRASLAAVTCVGLGTMALARTPSAEGPLLGHTGGFGEPTCRICHAGSSLNAPGGSLGVVVPSQFRCEGSYSTTIHLERSDLSRAGFQLAIRFVEGVNQGRQAGRLRPGPGVEVIADSTGTQYAQHSLDGTVAREQGAVDWAVTWEAPSCPAAAVALHVAANASNDDDSEFGDHIYTAAMRLEPEDP